MQVSDVHHQPALGKNDHDVINFRFNCYLDNSKSQEKFNYDRANFDGIRWYEKTGESWTDAGPVELVLKWCGEDQ